MSTPINNNNNYLAVTALGKNNPDAINKFSKAIYSCGCNIINCKTTSLGQELSIVSLIEGNWNSIAKIETILLTNIGKKLELDINIKRTSKKEHQSQSVIYIVHAITIDRPGIINNLTHFFSNQALTIEDISTYTYLAHNNTTMVSISININIPITVHIATLREQFICYCDKINLDAGMEPLKDF